MLTVSWQPWTDSTSGYNLADLSTYETNVVQYSVELHPHLEAIRQAIIRGQIWTDGGWTDNEEE